MRFSRTDVRHSPPTPGRAASRGRWAGVATLALTLALALPVVAGAQRQPAGRPLPEPRLVDTPWGDFPLGRLRPGARLRLTSPDGRRIEAQLATLGDSTLDLRSPAGSPVPPVTFSELRAYRMIEVRAAPAWRERAGTIGFVTGAVVGGIVGAARHNASRSSGRRPKQSLGEDIAAHASVGFFVGWMTGRAVVGQVRWRPVTMP